MATHDRNVLKRADLKRFQDWLNDNDLAWRPGKGEYQLMQVKLQDGWPAICTNAQGVVTTPPALREMIQRFKKGLPYTGKTPRKPEENAGFISDLRDDIAMAAMQGLLARPFTKDEAGRPFVEWVAAVSYEIADEMIAARGAK